MQKPITPRLGLELGTIALSRTVITTLYRMMYPFLPIIARGLDVSIGAIAVALTARSVIGLASPMFGILSDRWGRKNSLLLGQGFFILGTIIIFLHPTYPVFFTGVVLASIGKLIFDATAQAFAGDRVPFSRRGLAIAIVEGSWSGAFLLGVPIMGWLIAEGGWVQPFLGLAVSGLVMGIFVLLLVKRAGESRRKAVQTNSFVQVLRKPSVLAMMATMFLVISGVQQLYISFGAFLEDKFMIQVVALGAVSAAFGVAELGGLGFVALITDRLGKVRAVWIGLIATALTSLAIPLFTGGVVGAVISLFLVFLSFEFTVVSGIALLSEFEPEARGSILATNLAVMEAANGIGVMLGTSLISVGILGVSLSSGLMVGAAALSFYRGVRSDKSFAVE